MKTFKVTQVYMVQASDKADAMAMVARGQVRTDQLVWQGVMEYPAPQHQSGWLAELKRQLAA